MPLIICFCFVIWSIKAFYKEFIGNLEEDAVLVILTNAYHSTSDFREQVDRFLRLENFTSQSVWNSSGQKPRIKILSGLSQSKMHLLYASVNGIFQF